MNHQYSKIIKFILPFLIIFEQSKSMNVVIGATIGTGVTISSPVLVIPAIALTLAYKLLLDRTNPISQITKSLDAELAKAGEKTQTPTIRIVSKTHDSMINQYAKIKLENFFDEFSKKQQEILNTTYNLDTRCININNLRLEDYTSITKTIFNTHMETEENRSIAEDRSDTEGESSGDGDTKIPPRYQRICIHKQPDGAISFPELQEKIQDSESFKFNSQNIAMAGSIALILYKLGVLLHQTYKSIEGNLSDEDFEASLKNNPIALASYQNKINELWLLLLQANSALLSPHKRIEALLKLNKIHLPGKQGHLIHNYISKLNSVYFTSDGNLILPMKTFDKSDNTSLLSPFLRLISNNQQEFDLFGEIADYNQITDFKTYKSFTNFSPIDENNFDKILQKCIPTQDTIDQKVVLQNPFNKAFQSIQSECEGDLSDQQYNPYNKINDTYLSLQKLKNSLSEQQINFLKNLIADQSELFDDFNMLKIFAYDPLYVDLQNKENLLEDEAYRDKVFNSLRDRYNSVSKMIQNLNLSSNISPHTQTFLYSFLDKQITLDTVLKAICKPDPKAQLILNDFANDKGILKAFEERAAEFPQLAIMSSCMNQPAILKLLNRYLMFYPTNKLKPFFEEGLNYLVNSIDSNGQVNHQYLDLAKAYYTLINNANDRSILLTSDFTATTNDFDCKYCVDLNNNCLQETSHILRVAAKKLKTETDPYKKDLARFLIYAIRHLNQHNWSNSRDQLDTIIRYLKKSLDEPIKIEEFLGNFTEMVEKVNTSDVEPDQLLISSNLYKKIHKQAKSFIAKALQLINQRTQVNNFYKQIHFTKNPDFYNLLEGVNTLCASVLYKAQSQLDNEALEIAKIAEELSAKANELAINIVPAV